MSDKDSNTVLGLDFGASNGRGVLGKFDGNIIQFQEITRFPNRHVNIRGSLYWDPISMLENLRLSVWQALKAGYTISSVAIDSWAQDFGIIDNHGALLYLPHCYRDPRGKKGLQKIQDHFSTIDYFLETGAAPNAVSTASQLASMQNKVPSAFQEGNLLLFLSDLLGFWLTGVPGCEESVLSMSGLYDNRQHQISSTILQQLAIPATLFPKRVQQLQPLGQWADTEIPKLISTKTIVMTIPHHDTASAFTIISAFDDYNTIYLSLGTWVVCGIRLEEPLINAEVLQAGISNMIGLLGEHYLTINITGLWIEQQCKQEWELSGYKVCYDTLAEYAWNFRFPAVIDIEADDFTKAGNMQQRIQTYCMQNSLPVPYKMEDIYSCIINSLAIKLCEKIKLLLSFSPNVYNKIHIVGGGVKNSTLCKLIAEYSGIRVQAGPIEASIAGNILSQYMALGEISNLKEAKTILEYSFNLVNII